MWYGTSIQMRSLVMLEQTNTAEENTKTAPEDMI